jgi:murein L,D-transpeptidase YcbB/YkuD
MIKQFILSALFFYSATMLQAQNRTGTDVLHHPELVSAFYTLIDKQNFWLDNTESLSLRKNFVNVIDSAAKWALDATDYHDKELHRLVEISFTQKDSVAEKYCELVFTDAAISFFKDLYEGSNNNAGYDELSSKCTEMDKRIILNKLVAICNGNCLEDVICSLEPVNDEYLILKSEYQKQIAKHSSYNLMQFKRTLNYLRWINHFKFEKYIVVNIPSASLNYYKANTITLTMKAVVGKPSTQTPRFAAYCNKVILYPYWNVPNSIAVKELLPLYKKNPGLLNAMNMQVIDNNGKVVNASKLNWSVYTRNNFPFRFRQSTGCDNALGVMKFNLTDPFNVYMHDTNNKSAFLSQKRFYSHGCVRIEQPLQLANCILPTPVDSSFVRSCLKDEKPMELNLVNVIPVFVIYSTVTVNARKEVVYLKDVYHLLKK